MSDEKPKSPMPAQHQDRQPGLESEMTPRPEFESPTYRAAGKLEGKVAIVTGGDSGIGRAVAVTFAKEGADVAIVYLDEHDDAKETVRQIEQEGRRGLAIAADLRGEAAAMDAVARTVRAFGRLDTLVNNAAYQVVQESIADITEEQLDRTFRTNIYAYFFMVKASLPHLKPGSTIINTSSVVAYRGAPMLLDYSSTKGANVAFTRSLSQQLIEKGIRVNSVAPGPIWTPFIPSALPPEEVAQFGADTPMKRPGQPSELAPAYVYLASEDSSYVAGQTIHVNGGEVING
ncbi:MAG: glucose 1-dehydrogenase [Cytophagales bacterium]|nr:glucose 1-dehydrogenase [Armatimonadota bacterium]